MCSKGDMNIGSTDDSSSASSEDDCSTESFDDSNKKKTKKPIRKRLNILNLTNCS